MTKEDLLKSLHASLADEESGGLRIDDRQSMSVPDGYFLSLPDEIMSSIALERSRSARPHRRNSIRLVLASASAAAAIALLLGVGLFFYNEQKEIETQVNAIVASDADADAFVDMLDGENVEDILADAEYMY